MSRGDDQGLDFKPFFDMIVGVLFVLLIMVAAQIFFSQWEPMDPDRSKELKVREMAEQRAREFDLELSGLLERFQTAATMARLTSSIDKTARTIRLPLGQFMEGTARPQADMREVAKLGRVIVGTLGCATEHYSARPPCPSYERIRLQQIEPVVRVREAAPTADLMPDAAARLIEAVLGTSLVAQNPELLLLRAPDGALLWRPGTAGAAAKSAAAAGAQNAGDIELSLTVQMRKD